MKTERYLDDMKGWGFTRVATIPDLDKGQIYVSHVGDGEYTFNVFGGIYNDKDILLWQLSNIFINDRVKKIIIFNRDNEYKFVQYTEQYCFEAARITIETLNPKEFYKGM